MKGKRTPTDQLDSFSIFCQKLREGGYKLQAIANITGKHHATILHHLKLYDEKWQTSREFRKKDKDFRLSDFVETYQNKKIKIEDLTVAEAELFLIN